MRIYFAVILVTVLAPVAPAAAQANRSFGVTLGYPAQFGFVWHISDRIAIRPDIGFSVASSETQSDSEGVLPGSPGTTITSAASTDSVSARITALVRVARWDQIGLYVAPSYSYSSGSGTTTTTITTPLPVFPGLPPRPPVTNTTTIDTRSHAGGGAIGVQVGVHERFAIFAETGLRYTKTTTEGFARNTSSGVSSAGSLGAVLYF
jgi:hypothetical protein